MTPKLSKAVEAIEKLPQARQDELADLLLDAATRATIDDSIETPARPRSPSTTASPRQRCSSGSSPSTRTFSA